MSIWSKRIKKISRKFLIRRFVVYLSIFVVLLFLPLAMYLLLSRSIPASGWYNSSWLYRKPITLSEAGTNVDILIPLDTATLVGEGKMKNDCGDLRFVDSDGSTSLAYWIEDGCNTASTNVWVRVPNSSPSKKIYMYYGNSSATTTQETWSGNVMMYADTTCPTGWTQASELNNKFLYGSSTYGSTGGSDTHSHSNAVCNSSSISTTNISVNAIGLSNYSILNNHTHTNLTSAITSASNIPSYKNMVLCYKNSFTLSSGLISLFTTTAPSGWTRISALDNVFPRVASAYGGTGGSNTHTHSATGQNTAITTNTSSVPISSNGTGIDGSITISTAGVNMNTTRISSLRNASCPDAPSYNVLSFGADGKSAVVNATVSTTCMAIGDEVLIINLQGTSGSTVNVGNYETLIVSGFSVDGYTIYFETAKTKYYGTTANNDANLGTTTSTQRVMLQRVPQYQNVTIQSGGSLTVSDWNREKGGVLFFRATGTVSVVGSITTAGKGYLGGEGDSTLTTYTQAGESLFFAANNGFGAATTTQDVALSTAQSLINGYAGTFSGGGGAGTWGSGGANGNYAITGTAGAGNNIAGGGGGGGSATGGVYLAYDWWHSGHGGGGGGGGYGTGGIGGSAGTGGGDRCNLGGNGSSSGSGAGGTAKIVYTNPDGSSTTDGYGGSGGGGSADYGDTSLTKIFFGSGGGAGGTGESGGASIAQTPLKGGDGGDGGGIILISAANISIGGSITSSGNGGTTGATQCTARSHYNCGTSGGGGGGAGGSIRLEGGTISLGSSLVLSTGGSGSTSSTNCGGGNGGSGRIAIYANSLSGSTNPSSTNNTPYAPKTIPSLTHTHTVTGSVSSVSNEPPYLTMIFAKADSSVYVNEKNILMTSSLPPLGYNRFTELDNKFVMGSSSYGTTGGASTHTHTITNTTGGPSGTISLSTDGALYAADSTHTHTCSVSSDSVSNLPAYSSVIYMQRKVSQDVTTGLEETEESETQSSTWADSNWLYRRSVQVENTGTTVSNEDVLITVDTSTLISNSTLQPDCDDLRFVDSDDSLFLDYWIEGGCNTTSTKIWVRIPTLNSGGETIYMYYGNSSATTTQESWSGNVMMYADTTCPTGWTQASELNDKFLYGGSTYGSTGGSDTHSHSNAVCTSSSISTTSVAATSSTGAVGTTTTHTHDSLTSAIASSSTLPSYKGAVLCYKNSFSIPTGLISLFKSSLPTDWSSFSALDNVFPRVEATYGSTGGSNTHTHTTTTGTATSTSTNTSNTLTTPFSGTGGTITTSGSDTIHKFSSSGTFTANKAGVAQVLVVAGGGGGGSQGGGGGGAGGVVYNTGLSIPSGSHTVTVGVGGASRTGDDWNSAVGGNGGNSSIGSLITAIGGGGGGAGAGSPNTGGSGGGGATATAPKKTGAAGTAGQGNAGGTSGAAGNNSGAGGGGAGAVGGNTLSSGSYGGGVGGAGIYNSISGSSVAYGGGGGGGNQYGKDGPGNTGGVGGGGRGGLWRTSGCNGIAGTANTGGGGGGGGAYGDGYSSSSGAGGSGIVIIRYATPAATSGTVATSTHTHTTNSATVGSGTNTPLYLTMIFGKANTNTYASSDNILMTSSLPPLGYNRFTELDNKFVMGSSTYGTTGGSANHTHTVTNTTGAPSATMTSYGSGISLADSTHTHSCSVTSDSVSNLPAYSSVIYMQRKESKTVIIGAERTENTKPFTPTLLQTNDNIYLNPYFSAIFTDTDASDTGNYYQIQVNTSSDFTGTSMWDSTKTAFGTPIVNGNRSSDISYAGTSLSYGTTYYWRIKFWDNNSLSSEGDWSAVSQFTTLGIPNTPTILTTTPLSTTSIRWNFTYNSGTEDGIYLLDSNGNLIKTCTGTDITYCDESGLTENTQYGRKIVAYNDAGDSEASQTTNKYTLVSAPTISEGLTKTTSTISLTSSDIIGNSELYFDCEGSDCDTGINQWVSVNEATVTSLLNNTGYTFKVKARNGDDVETEYSSTKTIYTYSAIPTISVDSISTNSISLNTEGVNSLGTGQTGIYIECLGESCNDGISEWVSTSSDVCINLNPNTKYTFKAKSRNYDGIETELSQAIEVNTKANIPNVPVEISNGKDNIKISIDTNGNPEATKYVVLEENTGKYLDYTTNLLVDLPLWGTFSQYGGSEGILINDLDPSTEYIFKVKAKDDTDVETIYSDELSVITKMIVPTNLRVGNIQKDSITWNILDSNSSTSGYRIYDENSELILSCTTSEMESSSCKEDNLISNTQYKRRVSAYNEVSESDISEIYEFYTLAEPSSISSATPIDTSSVLVNIEGSSRDTIEILESNTDKYFSNSIGVLLSTSTPFSFSNEITINGLNPNNKYSFKVRSLNTEDIATNWSSAVDVYTLAQEPVMAKVERVNSSAARLYINNLSNPENTEFAIKETNTNKYLDYTNGELVSDEKWGKFSDFGGNIGTLVNRMDSGVQYGFAVAGRNTQNVLTEWSDSLYISTKSILLNVDESIKVVLAEAPEVDLTDPENAQYGEQEVRILTNTEDYIIADIPVVFSEDLDWTDAIIESSPRENKTVVKLTESQGKADNYTMYVVADNTNTFTLCPFAASLSEVSTSCTGAVKYSGPFPQTQTVEGNEVSVSKAIIGGITYWVADGLSGTGGIGYYEEPIVITEDTTTENKTETNPPKETEEVQEVTEDEEIVENTEESDQTNTEDIQEDIDTPDDIQAPAKKEEEDNMKGKIVIIGISVIILIELIILLYLRRRKKKS